MSTEKGYRQSELKKCFFCDRGMMHSGAIVFSVVSLDRHLVNLNAVRKQAGLEMQIGALSAIMGPDEPLTAKIEGTHPREMFVCEPCGLKTGLWQFMEAVGEKAASKEES